MKIISRRHFMELAVASFSVSGNPTVSAASLSLAFVGSFTRIEGRDAGGRGITVFRIDGSSGQWTETQVLTDVENPSFLTVSRSRRFLYSADGENRDYATAFEIQRESGRLRVLNRRPLGAQNGVHLAVDPSNRYLIVVMNTGSLVVFPISSNGSLEPACDYLVLSSDRQDGNHDGPHPHQVQFAPRGQLFLVPDTGVHLVRIFQLNTATGKLTEKTSAVGKAPSGAGPRHATFHPRKPYVYVINEAGSSVGVYRHGQSGLGEPVQVISTVPSTFIGRNTGAEIAVAKSGRFLYASNRGHNSIAVFCIGNSGMLSPLGWESTQGENPRFAGFDPDERLFCAANQASNSIATFRVDADLGTLSATGQKIPVGAPTCIAFA